MGLRNTRDSYGAMARAFHWLTVVLVLVAWLIGLFRGELPEANRAAAMFVHISLGLAVVGLLVLRLLWRMVDPAPPPVQTPLGRLGDIAAASMHGLSYLLLLAVPVIGIVLVFARGRPLPVFGLFEIASPWPADRAFARSIKPYHEWLAHGLMALAFIHAAAALVHHFVFGDRTLRRMAGPA
ncbi:MULTISPECIES: cytochrome b [Rhodoplanes]|uniref:Cytochrome b561 n=1 Tax=Rhodoplanes serenus TaxID=200615 RepID=A0A327KFS6_9BRAD|nr:cytochrome b/b6 domain-containing protein [Rhodoplanes serenus]RAI36182.1 cytochrome B [Rhodoplanes serenus]VCU11007.1 Cytochrome b561 [Rhodoplanes serenus]